MSSPIDILFEQIFGYKPKKDGEAYEKISAVAMKLLNKDSNVTHDEKLRGSFSNTLYQIDVLLEQQSKKEMGEAKDYTVKGAKVGRGDLQKLGGALIDLNEVSSGMFFSATDYTGPAIKYAEASSKMIGKDIQLYNLRPSTKLDEQGRIMKIIISMHIFLPEYEKATYAPIFSNNGNSEIKRLIKEGQLIEGQHRICVDNFYDQKENVVTSVSELTSNNFGGGFGHSAQGSFYLKGKYLKISGHLIELLGLTYDIPFSQTVETIEIDAQGEHKLLIRNQTGAIDKLITDKELREITKDVK
ncbi:restriction endonuclease [Paenibacillus sp. BR2-3]|uniref:restriction endonuclease n=1 Tax=Paenibacillus sp. BR2-3 TaxID=3048494 RepID=UPI003977D00C